MKSKVSGLVKCHTPVIRNDSPIATAALFREVRARVNLPIGGI